MMPLSNESSTTLKREIEMQELSLEEIKARVLQLRALKETLRVIMERESTGDSIISVAQKLAELKTRIEDPYKDLLKILAPEEILSAPIPDRMKHLIEVFKGLGELYIAKGELSSNPEHYTDAAKFYQYVISISEKGLGIKAARAQILEDAYIALNNAKVELIKVVSRNSLVRGDLIEDGASVSISPAIVTVEEEINKDKLFLEELRARCKLELEEIDSELLKNAGADVPEQERDQIFIDRSRKLFEDIATSLKIFLGSLVKESELIIGEAPCAYTIVGLGSLALNQATPHSDLEFAILTENEEYKANADPKVRYYFKNLIHLVHFRVINLGETIIPKSKYGVDLEHLITRALNFDLGGKTPLGRIDRDKPYTLIQTVDKMLKYLKNENQSTEHIDKALHSILESTVYIYGDPLLLESYKAQATKFLSEKVIVDGTEYINYQIRAIKRLKESPIEKDYLGILGKPLEISAEVHSSLIIQGNIDLFKPELSESIGRPFDVKQEVYRLVDRYLYDLAFYCGIEPKSVWDAIERLSRGKKIHTSTKHIQILEKPIIGATYESKEAPRHLLYAATFATTLRLRTYLHNGAQQDRMSVFNLQDATEEQLKEAFHLPDEDLRVGKALFRYYYTVIPLYNTLIEFLNICGIHAPLERSRKVEEIFNTKNFYENSHFINGIVHWKLLRYNLAIKELETALREDPSDAQSMHILGILYNSVGRYEDSSRLYKALIQKHGGTYDAFNPHRASYISKLGISLENGGDFTRALEHHTTALKTQHAICGRNGINSDIAASLNGIGNVYESQGKYEQSLKYHRDALEMHYAIHGRESNHEHILRSLYNIANVYRKLERYPESLEYHKRLLEKYYKIHGKDGISEGIASSLNGMAIIYDLQKDYKHAIEYYEKSIKMMQYIHGNNSTLMDIIAGLNNMARAYYAQKKLIQGIKYIYVAYKKIYSDKSHEYYNLTKECLIVFLKDYIESDSFLPVGDIGHIMDLYLTQNLDSQSYTLLQSIAGELLSKKRTDLTALDLRIAMILADVDDECPSSIKRSLSRLLAHVYNTIGLEVDSGRIRDVNASECYVMAKQSFEKALVYSDTNSISENIRLYIEYAYFLIKSGNFNESYNYLGLVINNTDLKSLESTLTYSATDKATIMPVLQHAIAESTDGVINVNAIHYVYYLVISYHDRFTVERSPKASLIQNLVGLRQSKFILTDYLSDRMLGMMYKEAGDKIGSDLAFLMSIWKQHIAIETKLIDNVEVEEDIAPARSGVNSNDTTVVMSLPYIAYDNPLLNANANSGGALFKRAFACGGIDLVNALISRGKMSEADTNTYIDKNTGEVLFTMPNSLTSGISYTNIDVHTPHKVDHAIIGSISPRPVLHLQPEETIEQVVLQECRSDPFYLPFMNLVSHISKVPTALLDAWNWGGKIMSQIQSMVEGTAPELQTDAQSARLSLLFELLDYVRSGVGVPIPYFPHKPDTDPDDWSSGGGIGDDGPDNTGLGFPVSGYVGNFTTMDIMGVDSTINVSTD